MPDGTYSLPDLCGLADVTPRTVRYYISQGLLRSPGTSGPGARYDDGHLARLRLIRRLQREHLPLAEIRARLAALTDDEAIAQVEGPPEPPIDSALDYVRGVLGAGALAKPPAGQAPPSPPSAQRMLLRRMDMPPPAAPAFATPELFPPVDAGAPAPGAPAPGSHAAPTVEPPGAERSHWERFTLAPDVELHVRRPLTRSQNRAVTRLLEAARQLLEEDLP
jgi:DNA-binding transcriptional MerR regulator